LPEAVLVLTDLELLSLTENKLVYLRPELGLLPKIMVLVRSRVKLTMKDREKVC
jgi:hypothetical protein